MASASNIGVRRTTDKRRKSPRIASHHDVLCHEQRTSYVEETVEVSKKR